jgi:hypothetical protein
MTSWANDCIKLRGAEVTIRTRARTFGIVTSSGAEEAIKTTLRSRKVLWNTDLSCDSGTAVETYRTRPGGFCNNSERSRFTIKTITLQFWGMQRSRLPDSEISCPLVEIIIEYFSLE